MKNSSSIMLFFTFMVMEIMISISSNNWLGCWMGIEVNLISFLPIMMNKMSVYSSESKIKYFIIQSMGSSLLFISIMFMLLYNVNYLMVISLLIKMGCPPFHLWFPSFMEGLNWYNCFILMTVQKLTPIILMSYLNMNYMFIISCLWGSMGGLGYSSLQKIVAYSAIYNLGWIISGIYMTNYCWLIYYFIFCLTLMMVCYSFYFFGINYLNQFFLNSMGYMKMLFMMIIFLSMGETPPFLSFLPSMIMIYCLIISGNFCCCFILLMSALLVMFFYLRVVFTGLLINSISIIHMNYSFNSLFFMFSIINLLGLMIIFMIMLYF